MNNIDIILIIGVLFSLFYGLCCKQIWFPGVKIIKTGTDGNTNMTKSRYIHEIWFNFICSLVGWISIYILYKSLFVSSPFLVDKISWQHIFLFLIGMLGITGLLPHAFWIISRDLKELYKK